MKINRILLAGCVLLGIVRCDDIREQDISGRTVFLLAPSDGFTATESTVALRWEPMDGADEYLLRIGSPDLENADFIVLDTLMTGNKFTVELDAGEYQWCVQAINPGYQSAFECRSLNVEN